MTQQFQGPDGQTYGFPDNMSQDDIKGVFMKKFPKTGVAPSSAGTPPTPAGALPAGSSASGTLAGTNQPTLPLNPSTGDMPFDPKSGPTWGGIGQTLNDIVRSTTKGFSLGGADRLASSMPTWLGGTGRSLADEQKLTEQSENRLGPLSYATEGAGYMANPISDIGGAGVGVLGRGATLGAEGLSASTIKQLNEKGAVDPYQTALDTASNIGIGGALSAIGKTAGNRVPANMPTSENLRDAADNMWDRTAGARLKLPELQDLSRDTQYGFSRTGRPPETAGPEKLVNDITDAAEPGGVPVKKAIQFQNRANAFSGDDATYGRMISNHIQKQIDMHPMGIDINAAQNTDKLADSFDAARISPPKGWGQGAADYVNAHAWSVGHSAWPLLWESATGGMSLPHAAVALGGIGVGIPVARASSQAIGDILRNRAALSAQQKMLGIPDDPRFSDAYSNSIRKLLYGGVALPASSQ